MQDLQHQKPARELLEKFQGLVDAISSFNQDHSVKKTIQQSQGKDDTAIAELGKKGDDECEKLMKNNASLLASMGFEFQIAKSGAAYTQSGQMISKRIVLAIYDPEQLSAFFCRIQPGDIMEKKLKELAQGLFAAMLSYFLSPQILIRKDFAPGECANHVKNMTANCKKLGLECGTADLRLEQFNGGYLYEQLIAENHGLLHHPDHPGMGPNNWHLNFQPDQLSNLWSRALSALSEIKKNIKARALYEKGCETLSACLNASEQDVNGRIAEMRKGHSSHIDLRTCQQILAEARRVFEKIRESGNQRNK